MNHLQNRTDGDRRRSTAIDGDRSLLSCLPKLITDHRSLITASFAILVAILMTGCYSMPFEPMPKSDLTYANPVTVRDAFQASLQPRTKQLQSVTFRFFGKEMVGLGVLDVDAKAGTFKLACTTLSGAKLFDLQGNREKITADNSAPAFGKYSEEIAQAVGTDVQHIYLNPTPKKIDKIKHRKYKLTLIEQQEDGRIEYDFAGYDRQLVEKRVYEGRKNRRRINYFDYKKGKGGIYPKGVVLQNKKYHYRLIIRVKQEL